jgi:hypothetical protein
MNGMRDSNTKRRDPAAKGIAEPKANRSARKARVSFTLSQDSVEFIHRFKTLDNSPSVSAAVDKVIESFRRAHEMEALNANITAYYDSLSPTEIREDSAWGDLGMDALAAVESETQETPPASARENR